MTVPFKIDWYWLIIFWCWQMVNRHQWKKASGFKEEAGFIIVIFLLAAYEYGNKKKWVHINSSKILISTQQQPFCTVRTILKMNIWKIVFRSRTLFMISRIPKLYHVHLYRSWCTYVLTWYVEIFRIQSVQNR